MMLGPLFLLLAAAAPDFGTSPLVQPDHAHRWTMAQDDEELTGWVDEAWRSETVIDGVRYRRVLVRSEVKQPEEMVIDAIAVIDCQGQRFGMQRAILLKSSVGSNIDVPVGSLVMQDAETSSNVGNRLFLDVACGTGSARR